jgi:uncharacterized membrane protein YbhN (UPF0104 family)
MSAPTDDNHLRDNAPVDARKSIDNVAAGSRVGKKRWRRFLQFIVIVIILVFWARVLAANWDEIVNYPWRLSWFSLLQSFTVLMLQMFLISTIWWRALTVVGMPISWRQGTGIWLQSQIARYIPGGVWDLAGRLVLGQEVGVDKRRMSASVGMEMGLQVLSASLFLLFALLYGADAGMRGYLPIVVIVMVLALFMLTPPVFSTLVNWGLRLLRRPPLLLNIGYGNVLMLFLLSSAAHALNGLAFFLFARGLSSLPWSAAPLMISAFVGAWLIGYLAVFVPTGIGVREGALLLLLGPTFPFGLVTVAAIGYRGWIALRDLVSALIGVAITRGEAAAPGEATTDGDSAV